MGGDAGSGLECSRNLQLSRLVLLLVGIGTGSLELIGFYTLTLSGAYTRIEVWPDQTTR